MDTKEAPKVDDTTDDVVEQDVTEDTDDGQDPESSRGSETVTRAELDKVIRERQKAKQALRQARDDLAKAQRTNEGESEKATREAREAALAEADKRYKPLIIATSAKAELVAAGVKADKVARLTKLLDLGEIEVESDGSVSGLTEQVTELKAEWPELFEEPKPKRATSKAADGAGKPAAEKKLTVEEQLIRRMRGER